MANNLLFFFNVHEKLVIYQFKMFILTINWCYQKITLQILALVRVLCGLVFFCFYHPICWHLFWCRCKKIFFKFILKLVMVIKCWIIRDEKKKNGGSLLNIEILNQYYWSAFRVGPNLQYREHYLFLSKKYIMAFISIYMYWKYSYTIYKYAFGTFIRVKEDTNNCLGHIG